MREKNVLRKKVFLRKIKRCKNLFVFESEKQCCFPKSSPFAGENQVVKKVFFFYKWKNVFFKFLFENQVAPGGGGLVFKKKFENKLFPFVEKENLLHNLVFTNKRIWLWKTTSFFTFKNKNNFATFYFPKEYFFAQDIFFAHMDLAKKTLHERTFRQSIWKINKKNQWATAHFRAYAKRRKNF